MAAHSSAPVAPALPALTRRIAAEFLGTFVLVLGGVGTAVLAGKEVGYLGIALAFGLTVLVSAYAVGHISGGHFNPAVTIGLATARRFTWRDVVPYVVTQIVAAAAAALVLFVVAHGKEGFDATESGFGTNGYGDRSPDHYSLLAVLVLEAVLTAVFVYVILGVTDTRAPKGFAPLAIGFTLTLIHLVAIPVSNTSVNPARSIGPALFAGGDAQQQLWAFLLAPIVGALVAGATYALLLDDNPAGAVPLQESQAG